MLVRTFVFYRPDRKNERPNAADSQAILVYSIIYLPPDIYKSLTAKSKTIKNTDISLDGSR